MVVWRYLDASGADIGGSAEFVDQDEAEAWVSESWRDLLERGVESVELMDGDEVLYRMGLGPADES